MSRKRKTSIDAYIENWLLGKNHTYKQGQVVKYNNKLAVITCPGHHIETYEIKIWDGPTDFDYSIITVPKSAIEASTKKNPFIEYRKLNLPKFPGPSSQMIVDLTKSINSKPLRSRSYESYYDDLEKELDNKKKFFDDDELTTEEIDDTDDVEIAPEFEIEMKRKQIIEEE